MDAARTDFQVISHLEPGVKFIEDVGEAVKLAKEINNDLFDAIKIFPERLGAFGVLPIQSPTASAEEFRRL